MKKTIMIAAMAAIVGGATLTSCESKEKKADEAQQKVDDAKQDLKDAKNDAADALNAEYPAYKKDIEARIDANNQEIESLRQKIAVAHGTKPLDPARARKIEDLKKRNDDLRARLYGYEKEHGDWESFKREVNHDADELGKSIKDIGKDNVK